MSSLQAEKGRAMQHKEQAPVQVALPGASVKADLWANTSGAFVRHDSEATPKRQLREVCQHCGLLRPVKGWVLISYMEDVSRTFFAPLCEECNLIESARIERNRRRRHG